MKDKNIVRYLFILLICGSAFLSPALSLFLGILYALILPNPFPRTSKVLSKYMLQVAVVGLGFGLNLYQSLEAGREGMLFTIVSVIGVMMLGVLLGRWFKLPRKLAYLIASGTAICGGSAIAAVSPAIEADENDTSMSLAVIFSLNALALFLFPPLGHFLGLSQEQFGIWAAIAIHDTSSVVGAGATYGPQALALATTIKLTRALWIIPLLLVTMWLFRKQDGKRRISVPWFIFLFIGAMLVNTYTTIPQPLLTGISYVSHKLLSVTLFLIGSSLSLKAMKAVGIRPVLVGVLLWIIISVVTLGVVI